MPDLLNLQVPTDWPMQLFLYLVYHGTRSLTPFLQASSFLYWPYLLSTLVLAAIFGRAAFFQWTLWTCESSRMDYKIYFINALIWPVVAATFLLNESTVSAKLTDWYGAFSNENNSQNIALKVSFTLVIFVAYDLGRFLSHLALHRWLFLWEIHKVHHSATSMTPLTSYRAHPLELLVMSLTPTVFTGLATWGFNAGFGAGISVHLFLGLHVLLALTSFIDNLRHSPVWITYGSRIGKWVISPAHHQLHHSAAPQHWGCNLGFSLAVWDRLFGTLVVPSSQNENLVLGLVNADGLAANNPHSSLYAAYAAPVAASFKALILKS